MQFSHMSNLFAKEITSCFNDTVVKSLNKAVDNVAKSLNEIQDSFSNLCKALQDKVVAATLIGAMTEVFNKNYEEGAASSFRSYSAVVNDNVMSIVNKFGDRAKPRRCNLMIHNLPEPVQSSVQELYSMC